MFNLWSFLFLFIFSVESKMFAPNESEFEDGADDDEYTAVNKTKIKLSRQNKIMQKYMKTNLHSLKVELVGQHKDIMHISGTKIVLVCHGDFGTYENIMDKNSTLYIDWRLDMADLEDTEENFRLTISRQILVIRPAVERDSGYYQCVIDNEVVGTATIEVWTLTESLEECLICMMILSAAGFFPFLVAIVIRYCFAGKRQTLAEIRKAEFKKRMRQKMAAFEKVEYEADEEVRVRKEAEDYYAMFAAEK